MLDEFKKIRSILEGRILPAGDETGKAFNDGIRKTLQDVEQQIAELEINNIVGEYAQILHKLDGPVEDVLSILHEMLNELAGPVAA